MKNVTIEESTRESALPFSTSVRGLPPPAKLTLMCLECVALGGVPASGLDDIHDYTGLSQRSFRQQLSRLIETGVITLTRLEDAVEISFAGHTVVLAKLRSEVRDDPWLIIKAKVYATKGSQCFYCGRDASHVDHVFPRSRGGSDDLSNLVPSCARCNLSKRDRTPEEWRS